MSQVTVCDDHAGAARARVADATATLMETPAEITAG